MVSKISWERMHFEKLSTQLGSGPSLRGGTTSTQQQLGEIGLNQLMVNCWFGAFSGLGFESGTPKYANPFHKGIPGIQTTGPQTNN